MKPIEVLEKVKDNKRIIRETLEETFKLSSEQGSQIKQNEKYKLIWEISNKIITTNYDKALEKSSDEIDNAVVHFNNDYGLAKLSNSDKFCLKIHGCISNPSTCILLEDEYKELYSDTLPKFEFEKLISDKTMLFLGFSLSDPYVNFLFETIKNRYNGYGRSHFIVSTNHDDFSDYGVKNIPLDSWDDLNPFLKALLEKKKVIKQITIKKNIQIEEIKKKDEGVKIAVFKANPIDRELEYNNEIRVIKKRNCQVDYFSLTIDNLNDHCDYDYYFILSEEVKGKILIESEILTSKLITLSDFENNICCSRLKGIIFILKNLNDLEIDQGLKKPYLFLNRMKKDRLSSIFFNLFKKLDYKFLLNSEYKMLNENKFTLLEMKGEPKHNEIKSSYISDSIDKRILNNFIGRKTDLIEITKKLLEAKDNDKILVIKGSGGIGKTTLIKKVALELLSRNIFEEGIYFVDCEFIKSHSEFQRDTAKAFNLEQEIDFFKYLKNHIKNKKRLIIIDNFETLNYLEETVEIKKILSKIADYATVVVTSRETLNLDFEDFYEIRSFTTDEAEKFFIQESNKNLNFKDKKGKKDKIILREDILENILGNNPLAIKLIANNIYKGITVKALKSDLEHNLFEINENFNFDIAFQESDRNIENRRTLAHSIYFSYKTLKEGEKFIFEILSLFPNGIYTENLRYILNNKNRDFSFKIGLNEIKALEKKSLIENNNGNIKLQSIVGRFAEQELMKRENTSQYFKEVYRYNNLILNLVNDNAWNKYHGKKILESNYKNLLKVFKFLGKINITNEKKIKYINSIVCQLPFLSNFDELIDSLKSVKHIFETTEADKNFYTVLNLYFRYYNGEFENTYKELQQKFPLNKIVHYDLNKFVTKETMERIIGIYEMEGLEFDEIKLLPLNKKIGKEEYISILFRMGEYDSNSIIKIDQNDFLCSDMKYNLGLLNENLINNHLNSLHEKDFLNILQINYIKAKMNLISKQDVEKLIVINPYTKGLKELMYAFLEEDIEKKINFYQNALKFLSHIKYYYIEALYYYSLFLKENHIDDTFKIILNEGIELSKKYNYRFLFHNFICLKNGTKKEYVLDDYSFKDNHINNFFKFVKNYSQK